MSPSLLSVPAFELTRRLSALRTALSHATPDWQMSIITSKLSIYYFTGVMHDGVVVIQPDTATFWVRRDYAAASVQSAFADIRPMTSFRTLGQAYATPTCMELETGSLTLDRLSMLRKHLPFAEHRSLDKHISGLRAVKSRYEIECMQQAGNMHDVVLGKMLPELLCEGMSEAEATGVIFGALLSAGTMGVGRFQQPFGEDVCGVVSFGTNMLLSTAFDGPFSSAGTCPAMPVFGSHTRLLAKNDLVLVDMPAGCAGYNTDKTVLCHCGNLDSNPHAQQIRDAHQFCLYIEQEIANRMVVGAIPSQIYTEILALVPTQYQDTFMNGVKFLGQGVGLVIDETPVLAKGFDAPLVAGNALAVEPKIALPNLGGVGTENTWLVRDGAPALCLTGGSQEIVEI